MKLPTEQELYRFIMEDNSVLEGQSKFVSELTEEIVNDNNFSSFFQDVVTFQTFRGVPYLSILIACFTFGIFIGIKYNKVSKEIEELDRLIKIKE